MKLLDKIKGRFEVNKLFKDVFKELKDKKASEIKAILNSNQELKEKCEDLSYFFGGESEYGIAFLDEKVIDNLENSGIIKIKKERIDFINKIRSIIKLNNKLLKEKEQLNLDLNNNIDLDYVYDILSNKTYKLSSQDLRNLYFGIVNNANVNINSKYLMEVIGLIVNHKFFSEKTFQYCLNLRIIGHNLTNSYIKVLLIFAYNRTIKDINNFFLNNKIYLSLLENLLIANDLQYINKLDLIKKLDLSLLELIYNRLKENIHSKDLLIVREIKSHLDMKLHFQELVENEKI